MPWGLLILVLGIVLRFGVDGYNLAGDILIWIGAIMFVFALIVMILVASVMATYNKSLPGKLELYGKSLGKRR